ncbi:hypothetical protein A0H81_07325 [Grifola frondosa]|uniref:Uncharacterized protein n=1 Tax=Grifola frondosa TaxID=5627 RepID=A0A1C7M8F4_GRIFR|nr:hypothetical protein A0H81_07325 [Grifola frondosa]
MIVVPQASSSEDIVIVGAAVRSTDPPDQFSAGTEMLGLADMIVVLHHSFARPKVQVHMHSATADDGVLNLGSPVKSALGKGWIAKQAVRLLVCKQHIEPSRRFLEGIRSQATGTVGHCDPVDTVPWGQALVAAGGSGALNLRGTFRI